MLREGFEPARLIMRAIELFIHVDRRWNEPPCSKAAEENCQEGIDLANSTSAEACFLHIGPEPLYLTVLGLFLPRRPVFWQVCEQIGQAFTRFHNISRKRQPVCLVIGWTGFLSRFAKWLLAKLVKQIDTLLWLLGGTAQIYWHDMNSTTVV